MSQVNISRSPFFLVSLVSGQKIQCFDQNVLYGESSQLTKVSQICVFDSRWTIGITLCGGNPS